MPASPDNQTSTSAVSRSVGARNCARYAGQARRADLLTTPPARRLDRDLRPPPYLRRSPDPWVRRPADKCWLLGRFAGLPQWQSTGLPNLDTGSAPVARSMFSPSATLAARLAPFV